MALRTRHITHLANILGGPDFNNYVNEKTKNFDEGQLALLVSNFPGGDTGDFEKTIDRLFYGEYSNRPDQGCLNWQSIGANS